MNRVLKRPMFRIGGSAGTGITSGLDKPRQKYNEAGRVKQDAQRIFDIGMDLRKDNLIRRGSMIPGSVPSFLTSFGLNLVSATPRGNIFQTAATAAQQPFQQFQQARLLEQEKARARRDAALSSAVASAVDLERERIEATAGTDYAKKQEIDLLGKIYDNKIKKIEEELAGLQPNDPSRQSLEAEVDKLREQQQEEARSILTGATTTQEFLKDTVLAAIKGGELTLQEAAALFPELKPLLEAQGAKDGGRIGYQIGGNVSEEVMETAQDTGQIQDLTYTELRSRLPQSVDDSVVKLLANSKQALLAFANIRDQQDVDQFNQTYGVNLTIPQEG
tara:strand:- start:612 stop:1610 length:999 start_codon:yes stop_codon:yes gene_type:complete